MIGPAEIEDLMLEFDDAQAAVASLSSSASPGRTANRWSWGCGPTVAVRTDDKLSCLIGQQWLPESETIFGIPLAMRAAALST